MDGFDIHDPEFRSLVLPNAPLATLGDGFAWLEGAAWLADQDCLLVSDLPGNRLLRWSEAGGISVFRQPSGFANGHTRDQQGRLFGCSHQHRCITRTELNSSITVLADRYEGRPLNGPNGIIPTAPRSDRFRQRGQGCAVTTGTVRADGRWYHLPVGRHGLVQRPAPWRQHGL